MLEFAERSLKLGARQKDGKSLQWHLERVLEQTGKAPLELEIPSVPHELAHVWGYFLEMNRKRQCGMGVSPLADSEILAWERRNRIALTPFEGECIDALDEVFLILTSEAPK